MASDTIDDMQARWVGFKQCWVTAADDDTLRTWNTSGAQLQQFAYMGNPAASLSTAAPFGSGLVITSAILLLSLNAHVTTAKLIALFSQLITFCCCSQPPHV